MTILLVDDNPMNLFVIEKILKSGGYIDYVSLGSAYDLFSYLEAKPARNKIDLILLDIMMPEIDGIEACRRIKQNDKFKDIQVIFVTALEDKEKLSEAFEAGGIDYVTKPINKVELLARIHAALRLKNELDWHTEKEKQLKQELDLAVRVQQSLLSKKLEQQNLYIDVSYSPSSNLAGDMYYWYAISETRYAVILFDMMGHGISASLVCMYISSVLREAIRTLVEPELVIKELNRYMLLLQEDKSSILYYFTAIYLVIDTEQQIVQYVNAGHPAGYALLDGKETVALNKGCCAVGIFDEIEIITQTLHYQDSIQLVMYTDGVLEAMDTCEIKAEESLQAIASHIWDKKKCPISNLLEAEQLAHQTDDICVVLLQSNTQTSLSHTEHVQQYHAEKSLM